MEKNLFKFDLNTNTTVLLHCGKKILMIFSHFKLSKKRIERESWREVYDFIRVNMIRIKPFSRQEKSNYFERQKQNCQSLRIAQKWKEKKMFFFVKISWFLYISSLCYHQSPLLLVLSAMRRERRFFARSKITIKTNIIGHNYFRYSQTFASIAIKKRHNFLISLFLFWIRRRDDNSSNVALDVDRSA
jgi:hypothetical protein